MSLLERIGRFLRDGMIAKRMVLRGETAFGPLCRVCEKPRWWHLRPDEIDYVKRKLGSEVAIIDVPGFCRCRRTDG